MARPTAGIVGRARDYDKTKIWVPNGVYYIGRRNIASEDIEGGELIPAVPLLMHSEFGPENLHFPRGFSSGLQRLHSYLGEEYTRHLLDSQAATRRA